MKGVNKVILLGNLGDAPEVKILKSNVKVARFSLATTEFFKDQDGKRQSHTEWHTVLAWRDLADLVEQYLYKGSLAYIEGKIRTRYYQDKDGKMCSVKEIIVKEITLLDKKHKEYE